MNRVQRLGLSAEDFKNYLILTGQISVYDLQIDRAKVSQLMSRDDLWEHYEAMAEIRASASENGLPYNGRNKNANKREQWNHVS